MRRDGVRAAALLVAVSALVAAGLWGLTLMLHARWLQQMLALAGADALAARGYYEGIGPFADPTFSEAAGFMRVLMIALPPVCGLVAALTYLWPHSVRRRDEKMLASRMERMIRGEALHIKGGSLLDEKSRQLSAAMAEGKRQSETEREGVKRLVNDISHQLKTPVAALRLHTELLEEPDLSEPERASLVLQLKAQVLRIEALAQSLVKTARLESGLIQIAAASSDLSDTVHAAISAISPKAAQKHIVIETDPLAPLIVPHDPAWTQEAIANVLDNAVKYTPEGGSIRVALSLGASYARLDIEDSGSGLSAGELGAVFGRFQRGAAAQATGAEGSGLGLHIAREILRKQGGSITAENVPGGGARFSLFLQNR